VLKLIRAPKMKLLV